MDYQFEKHYTRAEASALLPQVRVWLKRLLELRATVESQEETLAELMQPGNDLGGPLVNDWVRTTTDVRLVLLEFYQRQIQIKRLDRPLIDFPAILDGKEVFLCWEEGESDIEFWHDLHAGYAGRERLE
jgi:hypothetical protein